MSSCVQNITEGSSPTRVRDIVLSIVGRYWIVSVWLASSHVIAPHYWPFVMGFHRLHDTITLQWFKHWIMWLKLTLILSISIQDNKRTHLYRTQATYVVSYSYHVLIIFDVFPDQMIIHLCCGTCVIFALCYISCYINCIYAATETAIKVSPCGSYDGSIILQRSKTYAHSSTHIHQCCLHLHLGKYTIPTGSVVKQPWGILVNTVKSLI